MKKKASPSFLSKPFDSSSGLDAALGILLAATLFFSGDLNERSGAFAVLAVLWILVAAVRAALPLLRNASLNGLRSTVAGLPLNIGWIDGAVFLFFGFVVLSTVWNLLPGVGGSPRPSLNMLAVWLGLAAAWFVFRQTLDTPRLRNAALRLVLAVMVAEAVTGLYQQFVEHPGILRQFEADPVGTVALADPSLEPHSPEWDRFVFRLKTAGPIGTYPLTNTLGGLLGTCFVLMLGSFVVQRVSDTKDAVRRSKGGLAVFLTLLVLFCFLLTKCRSGFVAVAVGLFLIGIIGLRQLDRRWRRGILLGGVGVFLILAAAATLLPGKSLLDGAKRSLGFRLEYWQASLGMIHDAPVFGCGSGNFKPTYMKYKLPGASEEIADPHNFAVELAAVSGIPGLILFVLPVGFVIVRSLTSKRSSLPEEQPTSRERFLYWSGLGGGVLAVLVSLNAEALISYEPLLFLFVAFPLVAFAFPLERETPPNLLATTLIVLLVHLSAAGGISASNTAIEVWLLLALLTPSSPHLAGTPAQSTQPTENPSKRIAALFLLFFVVSLFVVNQYCLRPVVGALSFTVQLEGTLDVPRRVTLLREAATADPWSADVQEKLATEAFRAWFEFPLDQSWKAATLDAQEKALRLAPRSAGLRFVFAERLFAMFVKTGDKTLQDRSLELFSEAVERYPNHARMRAPFALALWKSGRKTEAIDQRDAALRLDDLMHHADQKLSESLRKKICDL